MRRMREWKRLSPVKLLSSLSISDGMISTLSEFHSFANSPFIHSIPFIGRFKKIQSNRLNLSRIHELFILSPPHFVPLISMRITRNKFCTINSWVYFVKCLMMRMYLLTYIYYALLGCQYLKQISLYFHYWKPNKKLREDIETCLNLDCLSPCVSDHFATNDCLENGRET